jgi:hypothetical protein
MYNVHTRGVQVPNVVLGMAIFGGGLAQLLAGMWEIPNGNTYGATGKDLQPFGFLEQRVTETQSFRPTDRSGCHMPLFSFPLRASWTHSAGTQMSSIKPLECT